MHKKLNMIEKEMNGIKDMKNQLVKKKVERYARGGFTLIEVMIVIAIIGILSAIAIPNFIAYRDKAYCSGAEIDANSIINTLAAYYAIPVHHGGFSGTISADGTLTPALGISFKPLSHGNTATITTVGKGLQVSVTDTNGRCPKSYRLSQANAGWSTTATVFRKLL